MTAALDLSFIDRAFRQTVTLVEFTWGPPADRKKYSQRHADVEEDVYALGAKYSGTPAMSIELPHMTGGIDKETAFIQLPYVPGTLQDKLSRGTPFAKVRCIVRELALGPEEQIPAVGNGTVETRRPEVLTPFVGTVTIGQRNPEARGGIVKLTVESPKAALHSANAGVVATGMCSHPYLGHGCFESPNAKGRMAVATCIGWDPDGMVISLDETQPGGAYIATSGAAFWESGWVTRDGAQVKIAAHHLGSARFIVLEPIPQEWIGQTVEAVAGCDHRITKCRFWGNEANHGAYAWGVPVYNPLFEVRP